MNKDLFLDFWKKYRHKSQICRKSYVDSLDQDSRRNLFKSFYTNGWLEFFMQNEIEKKLNQVKKKYNIDLIDFRIRSIKSGKIHLIYKKIWDSIEEMFEDYPCGVLFDGLVISPWGNRKQFYIIKAKKINVWR